MPTTARHVALVTAAGTAAGWHLISAAKSTFGSALRIVACDAQPAHLVAASTIADSFVRIPLTTSPEFRPVILNLLAKEEIRTLVAIHELDVQAFATDDADLRQLHVISTGVSRQTADVLSSKRGLSERLLTLELPVPRVYSANALAALGAKRPPVFLKPTAGFGSKDARPLLPSEPLPSFDDGEVLAQELCSPPEMTVEVYNGKAGIRAICRERLEVKNGVCTKARIWHEPALSNLAARLCNAMALPVAFCFQVMRRRAGDYAIIDINPRLGAGTAMSTCAGWSLATAAVAEWTGLGAPLDYLHEPREPVFVTRVYREILTGTAG